MWGCYASFQSPCPGGKWTPLKLLLSLACFRRVLSLAFASAAPKSGIWTPNLSNPLRYTPTGSPRLVYLCPNTCTADGCNSMELYMFRLKWQHIGPHKELNPTLHNLITFLKTHTCTLIYLNCLLKEMTDLNLASNMQLKQYSCATNLTHNMIWPRFLIAFLRVL